MTLGDGYHVGDCRELLRQLPDSCVRTCVTSPPYWGLRDYGVDGQLGLEATPEEYVANMVEVFREVRRVLRDDGTLWLNLGDCYITNPRGAGGAASSTLTGSCDSERRRQRWEAAGKTGEPAFDNARQRAVRAVDLKKKDLVGIPWMVAFALRADGWWLRMDVIWSKPKPNPMPESVEDRPTRAHEYVFLLSKSEEYFYDADAIAEPAVSTAPAGNGFRGRQGGSVRVGPQRGGNGSTERWDGVGDTRNRRSVWTIATQPTPDAHFATFPQKLVEPCVLAGSRVGDLVLDPFGGSGTVGRVAEDLGRRWILFDINPEYAAIAKRKTAQLGLLRRTVP